MNYETRPGIAGFAQGGAE